MYVNNCKIKFDGQEIIADVDIPVERWMQPRSRTRPLATGSVFIDGDVSQTVIDYFPKTKSYLFVFEISDDLKISSDGSFRTMSEIMLSGPPTINGQTLL